MHRFIFTALSCFFVLSHTTDGFTNDKGITVQQALDNVKTIVYPAQGKPVDKTVAEELQATMIPHAIISAVKNSADFSTGNTIQIGIAGEKFVRIPETVPDKKNWLYFKLTGDGNGQLITSKQHLLYAIFCLMRDQWLDKDLSQFEQGKLLNPNFTWITGMDRFYGTRRRFCRHYDPESAIKELARLGCSHVTVNALAQPFSMEKGPAGEIYYRYYAYAPDFDQFVETKLNKGTYSPEYLEANLNFLKEQSDLAVKYGLTPGMYVANPRSVPESLLKKYPYLRGARVDHTFRSYRPRFTLTLAHPLVRWHYAQLLKKILKEVPEMGFIITLINDSGSGFEYTESLYPGRNGGPYIVREWRPDSVIAKKAAQNIIRYYRTLRDAAHEINPEFRIITGLNNIKEEKDIILKGLDNGIDRLSRSQRNISDYEEWKKRKQKFEERGSYLVSSASARGSSYVLGIPSPLLTYERLKTQRTKGFDHLEVWFDPPSLAPYDVNREVLRAFQLNIDQNPDEVIRQVAVKWVGKEYASQLIDIWRLTEKAVRKAPVLPLYGGSGFTWFRFWDRPFVPDIGRIPPKDRAYYENYTNTVFNNPHNVDFQADALWDIHSVEECNRFVTEFDQNVWSPLNKATKLTKETVNDLSKDQHCFSVFTDLRDRLIAYRCYSRTLRNISAWIAGVHGYLDAEDEKTKKEKLGMVREMVENELSNTKDLLRLWENTSVDFMPIYRYGENGHDYGPNFGELLKKKIELTLKYKDYPPYIDPNYMWRMPAECEEELDVNVEPEEYLKY